MNVYFIELMLSKKCNMNCYYCNVWRDKGKTEADIDLIKFILNNHPCDNMVVEITGGEPGLITNLSEVYNAIRDYYNVIRVDMVSNGLVRKMGYEFIRDKHFMYREHLVYDIVKGDMRKFYNVDFEFRQNFQYPIILTENTIDSILSDPIYYRDLPENFLFKLMGQKQGNTKGFIKKVKKLFEWVSRPEFEYYKKMVERIEKNDYTGYEICSMVSPLPVFDIEDNKMIHCGVNIETSSCEIKKENIEKQLSGNIFKNDEYCKTCYEFRSSLERIMLDRKRGVFVNNGEVY